MLRSQRHVTSNWRFSSRRWGDGERAGPGPQNLFSGLFQPIRSGNISRSGQKVKNQKLDKVKVVTITISRATFSENEGQTMPGGNHGRSGLQGKRDYFKGRPSQKDLSPPHAFATINVIGSLDLDYLGGRRRTRLKKKHSRRERLVTIGSSYRSLDSGTSSADQVFNLKVSR